MNPMYKKLNIDELQVALFKNFNWYQEVKKCWRKEDNAWILKDVSFVEQWGASEKEKLVKCLCNTVSTGGTVFGAFIDNVLVGFASIENNISAHSSEESQAFYKVLGCVEAVEINKQLLDEEPFDYQLEYIL